jgi:D-hexose-6-phosphate mutarotase
MADIQSLNQQVGIPGVLGFIEGEGGLPVAHISNALAEADISLQGAHLLTWTPRNEPPVVWLSPAAKFAPGKSVRGGIPVCWPWFGVHASETSYPAHGFARTRMWELIASSHDEENGTRLVFELKLNDIAHMQWPHPFHLRLVMNIGRELTMELTTRNTGQSAFVIGEALHTYFHVGDISAVRVTGLENTDYLDKVRDFKRFHQDGAIQVNAEIDLVYVDTAAECVIHDDHLGRRIHVGKSGSLTTVVWNPWAEKCVQMGDMGEDGYRRMICVESANAHDNVLTLQPGESHTLGVRYLVERQAS